MSDHGGPPAVSQIRRDPGRRTRRLVDRFGEEFFTGRRADVEWFHRHVFDAGQPVPVLGLYGVGGVGKSVLVHHLAERLRRPGTKRPHAVVDLEFVGAPDRAARRTLVDMRAQLGDQGVRFDNFDMCLAVLLAREGGEQPPLVRQIPPLLGVLKLPIEMVGLALPDAGTIRAIVARLGLEDTVRRIGGVETVLELMRLDPEALTAELLRLFALDLEALPAAGEHDARAVVFLDSYEALWRGREGGASEQALLVDRWVRQLASWLLGAGVAVVISGRDRLRWDVDDPGWASVVVERRLDGFTLDEARRFLAAVGIGADPGELELQNAILAASSETSADASAARCHTFHLALCAEIVLNTRDAGQQPDAGLFANLPATGPGRELVQRFKRSLPTRQMETWIEELAATPVFDEQVALALDAARHHGNGRAGWEQLTSFSFVQDAAGGRLQLHRKLSDGLLPKGGFPRALEEWYVEHWSGRGEAPLAFFHEWHADPAAALKTWSAAHRNACRFAQAEQARTLMGVWRYIEPFSTRSHHLPRADIAASLAAYGQALAETPAALLTETLSQAIAAQHAALTIYTRAGHPTDWATVQNNLGNAYRNLPTGDRGDNLRAALHAYQNALEVYTRADHPLEWAKTLNNIGNVYRNLPTGNRGDNLHRAIAAYQDALTIRTRDDYPTQWAITQNNLGSAYAALPTGNRGDNLHRAIAAYQDALTIRTRDDYPTQWARTQHNLGSALRDLPDGDRDENVRQAIAVLEEALSVRTRDDYPFYWAMTQNELGLAYAALPTGERAENLRQAIAAYRNALTICTPDAFPEEWATVRDNLRTASTALAELDS